MLAIAQMSNESGEGRGIIRSSGGKGLSNNCRAKPLHVIDETFGSIPTDGDKCRYLIRLAFWHQRDDVNLKKRENGSGVLTASMMLKLPKRWRRSGSQLV